MNIDKENWHTCKLCKTHISELSKKYGGCGIYHTETFKKHLEVDHNNTSLEKYFDIDNTECGCHKQCGKKQKIRIHGANFRISDITCGRSKKFMLWAEKMKTERLGENNPMYGQIPWNSGLTSETSEILKRIADNQKGKIVSEETKERQSISAKKRLIHGHTGIPHTEESKQKMREHTLARLKAGSFKQTKTKPHICLASILEELGLKYEEEKIVDKWSFDFYLIDYDIFLEADGDYFHSNPKQFPCGPQTKTQKRNKYRDYIKNKFCQDENMICKRFWEYDILNNRELIKKEIYELLKSKKNK
jgi:very-short-patch-repair endonuclease